LSSAQKVLKMFKSIISICLFDFCLFAVLEAVEIDLTIYVEPGKKDCFHQFIKKGTHYEVKFQVLSGGTSGAEINVDVLSPAWDLIKGFGTVAKDRFRGEATEDGDHKFCLDNSFSRFSRKLVFFELLTDDEDLNDDAGKVDYDFAEDNTEDIYEVKLEEVKANVDSIRTHLDRSDSMLKSLRAIESRDRWFAERNFERVNFWSSVQLAVMVTVSLVQVLMVRSLFEEKRTGSTKVQT